MTRERLDEFKQRMSHLSDTAPGQYLKRLRPCLTCKQWHTALEIGTFGCRFHPLSYNEDASGRWWGRGQWECCGVSKDPESEFFDATYVQGCTARDHCGINRMPFPTKVPEQEWPALLREDCYKDVETINATTEGTWDKIVKGLKHKGLRIDERDAFYLQRIDLEMYKRRLIHQYDRDKCLTKCIKIFTVEDGTIKGFKEMILRNSMRISDIGRVHYGADPFTLYKTIPAAPTDDDVLVTTVAGLDEGQKYYYHYQERTVSA